jgi:acetate kinase
MVLGVLLTHHLNHLSIFWGAPYLRIDVNEGRNAKNAPVISPKAGRVTVSAIRTDEELVMARPVWRVFGMDGEK